MTEDTASSSTPEAPELSNWPHQDGRPLGLVELIREDYKTHQFDRLSPGFHAIALHRVIVWASRRNTRGARLLERACRYVNLLVVRNLYGIELFPTTIIGRRVLIGHHQGVVLGEHAVIGDDCVILSNVTLGMATSRTHWDQQPRLGCNVSIGAGATVIGGITIGDDVVIGPGAIVMTDLPRGTRIFAPPSRMMKPAVEQPD